MVDGLTNDKIRSLFADPDMGSGKKRIERQNTGNHDTPDPTQKAQDAETGGDHLKLTETGYNLSLETIRFPHNLEPIETPEQAFALLETIREHLREAGPEAQSAFNSPNPDLLSKLLQSAPD